MVHPNSPTERLDYQPTVEKSDSTVAAHMRPRSYAAVIYAVIGSAGSVSGYLFRSEFCGGDCVFGSQLAGHSFSLLNGFTDES